MKDYPFDPVEESESICNNIVDKYKVGLRCVVDWFEYDRLPFWKKLFTKKPKSKIFIKK